MNDMKKDTYTLWIDDELVATAITTVTATTTCSLKPLRFKAKPLARFTQARMNKPFGPPTARQPLRSQTRARLSGGTLFVRTTNPTATMEPTRRCKMEIIVYITTASVALAFYADL